MWHPLWQIAAYLAPAAACVLLWIVVPKLIEELQVRKMRRQVREMLTRRIVHFDPPVHHVANIVPMRKRRVH